MSFTIVIAGAKGSGLKEVVASFCGRNPGESYEEEFKRQVIISDQPCTLTIRVCPQPDASLSSAAEKLIRQADAFLLVYSVTKRSSLYAEGDGLGDGPRGLGFMRDVILRAKDVDNVPMVLVGNKCHRSTKREISTQEGQEMAQMWKLPFFEVSCKEQINNEECFMELVRTTRTFHTAAASPKTKVPRKAVFRMKSSTKTKDGKRSAEGTRRVKQRPSSAFRRLFPGSKGHSAFEPSSNDDWGNDPTGSKGQDTDTGADLAAQKASDQEKAEQAARLEAREKWKKALLKIRAVCRFKSAGLRYASRAQPQVSISIDSQGGGEKVFDDTAEQECPDNGQSSRVTSPDGQSSPVPSPDTAALRQMFHRREEENEEKEEEEGERGQEEEGAAHEGQEQPDKESEAALQSRREISWLKMQSRREMSEFGAGSRHPSGDIGTSGSGRSPGGYSTTELQQKMLQSETRGRDMRNNHLPGLLNSSQLERKIRTSTKDFGSLNRTASFGQKARPGTFRQSPSRRPRQLIIETQSSSDAMAGLVSSPGHRSHVAGPPSGLVSPTEQLSTTPVRTTLKRTPSSSGMLKAADERQRRLDNQARVLSGGGSTGGVGGSRTGSGAGWNEKLMATKALHNDLHAFDISSSGEFDGAPLVETLLEAVVDGTEEWVGMGSVGGGVAQALQGDSNSSGAAKRSSPNFGVDGEWEVPTEEHTSWAREQYLLAKHAVTDESPVVNSRVRSGTHNRLHRWQWQKGDRVKVTKLGSYTGKEAIVIDPNWTGRIKVCVLS
jgi:GTPase SAR1 family protein